LLPIFAGFLDLYVGASSHRNHWSGRGNYTVWLGKWLGANTLWLDSTANADEPSLSVILASKHSDTVLTQWSHLATLRVIAGHHMIFVTVGNMNSFDRLIQAVDNWIAVHLLTEEVIAQIADGAYLPKHCQYVRFLTPGEYSKTFLRARIVISHAGMGSIITAMELRKPIVVMPRRAAFGETRNEHQTATVRHFRKSDLILVAESETEFTKILNGAMQPDFHKNVGDECHKDSVSWPADPSLITFVRDFVTQKSA
jgi:UDP-N-acetylglucosamine transferase subunit ALG13